MKNAPINFTKKKKKLEERLSLIRYDIANTLTRYKQIVQLKNLGNKPDHLLVLYVVPYDELKLISILCIFT